MAKGTSQQRSLDSSNTPKPSRPYIPGYGVPKTEKGMLPWSHVVERMEKARNYWIGTTDPEGRPHATPVWGVWLDGRLYFDGGPTTRRVRNLLQNPSVVVHLESGDEVVILQGEAREAKAPERALTERLSTAYCAKYAASGYAPTPDQWDAGGLYEMRPRQVFAWTKFPKDTTRWQFE
jgi:nitroimidazol reductase NimA-like FMN-containing flavoprotein (pyridoxamine 5'-phosphate oxidase superfamily)